MFLVRLKWWRGVLYISDGQSVDIRVINTSAWASISTKCINSVALVSKSVATDLGEGYTECREEHRGTSSFTSRWAWPWGGNGFQWWRAGLFWACHVNHRPPSHDVWAVFWEEQCGPGWKNNSNRVTIPCTLEWIRYTWRGQVWIHANVVPVILSTRSTAQTRWELWCDAAVHLVVTSCTPSPFWTSSCTWTVSERVCVKPTILYWGHDSPLKTTQHWQLHHQSWKGLSGLVGRSFLGNSH